MRRTGLGLVVVALLVAVAIAVSAWPADGGWSTADELARRLAATDDLDRFEFDHRAGGTRVLDCFLPNRQITGAVDYDAALAVLLDRTGTEIARKRPDRVLLHRNLFAKDIVPTEWLELELPMDEELRSRLATILGTELAGYLLTPGLPASGRATAVAALEAADRVDPLPASTIDGRHSNGYRIIVDDDRFGVDPDDSRAAPTTDVAPPTIDVWIDQDDGVRRVTVLPGQLEPANDEAAAGWSIDYRAPGSPVDDRRRSSVTGAAAVDLDRLQGRPATGGCEVPL